LFRRFELTPTEPSIELLPDWIPMAAGHHVIAAAYAHMLELQLECGHDRGYLLELLAGECHFIDLRLRDGYDELDAPGRDDGLSVVHQPPSLKDISSKFREFKRRMDRQLRQHPGVQKLLVLNLVLMSHRFAAPLRTSQLPGHLPRDLPLTRRLAKDPARPVNQ